MLTFRNFLLLIVLCLGRELAPESLELKPADWWIAGCTIVLNLVLFAGLIRVLARNRSTLESGEHSFSVARRRLEYAWLVLHPLILWGSGAFGCAQQLSEWSVFLSYAVLMVPTLAALAMLDMEAGRVDALVSDRCDRNTTWSLMKTRLRLGELAGLAICLAPVFVSTAFYDVAILAEYMFGDSLRSSAFGSQVLEYVPAAFAVLALLLVLAAFPWFLGLWSGVQDLKGSSLGARIEYFREQVGIRSLSSVLVPSQGRWQGAAIVGWLPGTRRLWLGDALLEKLTRREVDMVLLHEMAHLSRRHFWWRSLPLVWALCINVCYFVIAPSLGEDGIPVWFGKSVALLLSAGMLVFGLGHISRSCELDADREACRLAERFCPWAIERSGLAHTVLADALSKLVGNPSHRMVRSWMHPSLHERLVSLASVLAAHRRGLKQESF